MWIFLLKKNMILCSEARCLNWAVRNMIDVDLLSASFVKTQLIFLMLIQIELFEWLLNLMAQCLWSFESHLHLQQIMNCWQHFSLWISHGNLCHLLNELKHKCKNREVKKLLLKYDLEQITYTIICLLIRFNEISHFSNDYLEGNLKNVYSLDDAGQQWLLMLYNVNVY